MATLNARQGLQNDDLYEVNYPRSPRLSNSSRQHHDAVLLAAQKPLRNQKSVSFGSSIAIGKETETVVRSDSIRF
jgi:hypothetical protein